MRAGRIFNEEKVLYFADRDCSFHVQSNEPKDSDCSRIVQHLHKRGMLTLVEQGAGGRFFEITTKGKQRLLELQIQWREAHGKNTDAQRADLEQLNPEGAIS